jgi:hypothetical protein
MSIWAQTLGVDFLYPTLSPRSFTQRAIEDCKVSVMFGITLETGAILRHASFHASRRMRLLLPFSDSIPLSCLCIFGSSVLSLDSLASLLDP